MVNKSSCEIGIIGLGVMGRNLLLNMADQGFTVAGYDKDLNKVNSLQEEAKNHTIHATGEIKPFIELLQRPRAILLLVPAGPIVDSVIQDLLPFLEAQDLIIDAGNSYFKDTDARTDFLKTKNLRFLGVGISGGEDGARHGPSIMPGGEKATYERVKIILEAIAAKVADEPCVSYLGLGSSGHFVKMVHNGIEYGIMQLIAESYDFMKKGLGLNASELENIYREWNHKELNSYLIEITSAIFSKIDTKTGKNLIDCISDVAKQNGTGMWTAQTAMELQIPVPSIDIAVMMRDLSVFTQERSAFAAIYPKPKPTQMQKSEIIIPELKQALYAAMVIVYAQGMAVLSAGSSKYGYDMNLETIARIWRGGCIIRSAILDDIALAFKKNNKLTNILLDDNLSVKIMQSQLNLRKLISKAAEIGLAVPSFMASLSYFDAFRDDGMPSNLIQAQRDYFGSHSYERIDVKGVFHTAWEKP